MATRWQARPAWPSTCKDTDLNVSDLNEAVDRQVVKLHEEQKPVEYNHAVSSRDISRHLKCSQTSVYGDHARLHPDIPTPPLQLVR